VAVDPERKPNLMVGALTKNTLGGPHHEGAVLQIAGAPQMSSALDE